MVLFESSSTRLSSNLLFYLWFMTTWFLLRVCTCWALYARVKFYETLAYDGVMCMMVVCGVELCVCAVSQTCARICAASGHCCMTHNTLLPSHFWMLEHSSKICFVSPRVALWRTGYWDPWTNLFILADVCIRMIGRRSLNPRDTSHWTGDSNRDQPHQAITKMYLQTTPHGGSTRYLGCRQIFSV